jgi:hypothetical protein
MALFAAPGIGGSYWTTFFPAVAVLGLGMAITAAPLTTSVLDGVDEESAGTASGINNAISRVAGLFSVALLGVIMLHSFSGALFSHLGEIGAPPGLTQEIMSARTQLAAIETHDIADRDLLESVRSGIAESFVAGFRTVAAVCSGLALAGAAIASVLLRGASPRRRRA